MRNTYRIALVAIAITMVIAALPDQAHALMNHMQSFDGMLIGAAMLNTATVPQGGITLVSKNRQAGEFRQQAAALRSQIMDSTKPLTTEELNRMTADITTLEARANAVASFTADAEIERQGGEDTRLERVDNPDATDITGTRTHNRAKVSNKLAERIEQFTRRIQSEFVDVRSFLHVAVAGAVNGATPAQLAVINEARVLTRAIVGTGGDISGGEFLLPLTQVQTIFSLSNVQQGILQRARAYNVPGRSLRIPYLIQDDAAANTTLNRPMAGQIANVEIIGEGSTKTVRQPQFGQRLLTVYKYAAITQVSDELLGDDFTGELPQEFVNAVGQQALNRINEDVTIDGTGTSMPLGALYPGAHNIAVARTTANLIVPADVFAMYARFTHGPNAVWLASRRTVQALYNMSLTSASLVTFLKDLSGTPQMMLLGYPIVLTDLLPTLGATGDFALVNPDFYALALRQALTVESSNAPGFIQDLMTYRFVVRAGGIPINAGKYAYKYAGSAGVDEHAPFVYLAVP